MASKKIDECAIDEITDVSRKHPEDAQVLSDKRATMVTFMPIEPEDAASMPIKQVEEQLNLLGLGPNEELPDSIRQAIRNDTKRVELYNAQTQVGQSQNIPHRFVERTCKEEAIKGGILSAIGNTPLIEMVNIFSPLHFRLFAKLEALNPGGSMKDRSAINIIRGGLQSGAIRPDSIIIESSSGNMGIGLAQACSYFGLKFICVVDPKTTVQNRRLLEAYGAEVNLVEQPDPVTGEFLQARLNRVKELLASCPNAFWTNQYANTHNSDAHHQTMSEIVTALSGKVDFVFCAISTFGTLRGCAEFIREQNLSTEVIAVDAVGSVIFDGRSAKRLIPGHGAAVRPPLYQAGLADHCVHITDLECIVGCRLLARCEAILMGGSSGAIIMAINQLRQNIPEGATCVAILPDRGERYLDTIYSDAWVEEHFGTISHLWLDSQENRQWTMATY